MFSHSLAKCFGVQCFTLPILKKMNILIGNIKIKWQKRLYILNSNNWNWIFKNDMFIYSSVYLFTWILELHLLKYFLKCLNTFKTK